MSMGLGKLWFGLLMILGSEMLREVEGSPTGRSGGFVLGAQWFVKNQNEGANGQYLTTDYKEKVVKLGFERVADKVFHNYQKTEQNFFMIVGVIIFEVIVVMGMVYNHYAGYVKMVKRGAKRSNPNVI